MSSKKPSKSKKTPKKAGKKSVKTPKKKASKGKANSVKKRSWARFWLQCFTFVFFWGAIFGAGLILYFAKDLPDIVKSTTFEKRPLITIEAYDGTVLTRYGDNKGKNIRVENLPPHVIEAVLAIEDRRFYDHVGLDPYGLARAMVANVRAGRVVQGGSTITQQLAKNLFLSQERTLKRKIQEALLAFWLEIKLSKDEILSAYLNRVYMGSGTYGIDAASQLYFGTPVRDLSLYQAATLAGLLKAPSRYAPSNNPGLSHDRAVVVLSAMVDAGYLDEAMAAPLRQRPIVPEEKPIGQNNIRYATDWILESLDDLVGTPEEDIIIKTTLRPAIQTVAENTIEETLAGATDKDVSQGAAMIMRTDGAVVAMVGGRDYGESQFNRATHALRPPGSSFKPFVYATALEYGFRPETVILDEPISEGSYRPTNFGGQYYDEVRVDDALALSLNTIAFRLAKDMNIGPVIDFARRVGIKAELNRDLSLALGSSGVPMIEMVTGYAAFATGGYKVEPYAVLSIRTAAEGAKEEKVLYRHEFKRKQRVMDERVAGTMIEMMQNVVRIGTGQAAKLNTAVAGKTGTSQDHRDAWFIGYTPSFVGAVWYGNDDNSPTKRVTGATLPAQSWRRIMGAATPPGQRFNVPSYYDSGFFGGINRSGNPYSGEKPRYNE